MSQQTWRINRWEDVFEKSDAARCQTLLWVSLPIDFGSAGYQSLLDDFGDEAPALFGCWCALVCVAGQCPVRGVLSDSKGIGLKLSWISRRTGFPVSLFEKLIAWAASPSVKWLVSVPADEFTVMLAESQNQKRRSRPAKSGRHPDESANRPDSNAIRPDENASCPDTVRTTRQDKTGQDITKQDTTQHHQTGHASSIELAASVLKDRWRRLVGDLDFRKEVDRLANKLLALNAKDKRLQLTRDEMWQVAWTSADFDIGTFESVYAAIRNGNANSPRSYLDGAMRRMCSEKSGQQLTWAKVRELVPPTPAPNPPPGTVDRTPLEVVS